ncbi:MAG: DUF1573 domain-containing protein, partial [Desulfosalsimonas sp.]
AGKEIGQSVILETNDSVQPKLRLRVTGKVEPYVTAEPRRVNLRGAAGEKISETVRILSQTKEALSTMEVSAVRGNDIVYELEEIKDSGEKGYLLHVKNIREKPGRYHDSIHLETDSERIGRITIPVSGIIQSAE